MAITKDKKFDVMSEDEIQAWQEKDPFRRKIEKVTLMSEDDETVKATYWIVAPDRNLTGKIKDMADLKKPTLTLNDLMINGCTLAGDLDTLDWSDSIYNGLLRAISEKMNAAKKA